MQVIYIHTSNNILTVLQCWIFSLIQSKLVIKGQFSMKWCPKCIFFFPCINSSLYNITPSESLHHKAIDLLDQSSNGSRQFNSFCTAGDTTNPNYTVDNHQCKRTPCSLTLYNYKTKVLYLYIQFFTKAI